MPMMYKRCASFGCTERVPFGTTFCETHKRKRARDDGRTRATSTERGYDAQWRTIRDGYLSQHPLCEDCLVEGITEAATMVHHIVPLPQGTSDDDNLLSLCKICHSKRHTKNV